MKYFIRLLGMGEHIPRDSLPYAYNEVIPVTEEISSRTVTYNSDGTPLKTPNTLYRYSKDRVVRYTYNNTTISVIADVGQTLTSVASRTLLQYCEDRISRGTAIDALARRRLLIIAVECDEDGVAIHPAIRGREQELIEILGEANGSK